MTLLYSHCPVCGWELHTDNDVLAKCSACGFTSAESKYLVRAYHQDTINSLVLTLSTNLDNLRLLLRDKIAVFDFDGTLTHYQYSENRLLPCDKADLCEYQTTHNYLKGAHITQTMRSLITGLNKDNVYIITKSVINSREDKNAIILSEFPDIPKSHIIHVQATEDKLEFLSSLYEKRAKPIVFIDDTVNTLLKAEEKYPFVKGYHISNLIP